MQAANIKSKIPIYKLYEPSFAVPFLISTTTQVLRQGRPTQDYRGILSLLLLIIK